MMAKEEADGGSERWFPGCERSALSRSSMYRDTLSPP